MIKLIVLRVLDFYKASIFKVGLEKKLDMAQKYLGLIFNYRLPIYGVVDLESVLVDEISNGLDRAGEVVVRDRDQSIAFLVSRPFLTGGHTRLMENLSLMLPGKKDLVVTYGCAGDVEERLRGYFSELEKCTRRPHESGVAYVSRIVECLKGYRKIVLNIHPDDIYAVLACAVLKKIDKDVRVYFVNHADHVASFGASVADYWFEISLYGRNLDNARGIRGIRSFLGIPINQKTDDFFREIKYPDFCSVKKFFTAGSSEKYRPFRGNTLAPLLSKILSLNKGSKITLIGLNAKSHRWLWWFLVRYRKRVTVLPSLPYEEYLKTTSESDYFIDSYPMPGGTAFVEQFLNGKPCVGLRASYYGYTPLEKLKSETVEGVVQILKEPPTTVELKEIQNDIYEVHAFECVKKRFLRCLFSEDVVELNPMLSYSERIKTDIEVPSMSLKLLFSRRFILFRFFLEAVFARVSRLGRSGELTNGNG